MAAAVDPLDPLERLLAARACERLIVDYARYLDLGEPARAAELFTDDAVWELPGRLRFEGRQQLDAGFVDRLTAPGRTARHVCTNIAVDVVSRDEAVGFCYMINYRHDSAAGTAEGPAPAGEPLYIGEYHDRFVRTPAGWRFAHRRTELAFQSERR